MSYKHEHWEDGAPPQDRDRVTATEIIDGVEHRIVLERDERGEYREVLIVPLALGHPGAWR